MKFVINENEHPKKEIKPISEGAKPSAKFTIGENVQTPKHGIVKVEEIIQFHDGTFAYRAETSGKIMRWFGERYLTGVTA